MGTKSAWTLERRARQAEIIRQIRPWNSSTGPRTPEGKAASSRNAYAGDFYHESLAKLASARTLGSTLLGRRGLPKSG